MTVIVPPDMNDSRSRVILGGAEYIVQFSYNFTGKYWTFGLFDSDNRPLIASAKIVPCFPLNTSIRSKDIPDGVFGAITQNETIARDDFVSGKAQFVWIPKCEISGEAGAYV